MKIYVIKKDSFVNVLDDNYKIKSSEQFSRDVQFDERWLYDTTKCECCDKKMFIFHQFFLFASQGLFASHPAVSLASRTYRPH